MDKTGTAWDITMGILMVLAVILTSIALMMKADRDREKSPFCTSVLTGSFEIGTEES